MAGANLAAQGRGENPMGVSLRENGGRASRQEVERTSLRTFTEEQMISAEAGGERGVVCFLKRCMFYLKDSDPAEGGGLMMQGSVGRACRERSLCT